MKNIYLGTLCSVLLLSGCASNYGNLVSGSKVGARGYQVPYLPKPGMDAKAEEIHRICGDVAAKGQVNAAQRAQLNTITGVATDTLDGAMEGLLVGNMYKKIGFGSRGEGAALGAVAGLVGGLTSSMRSGVSNTADKTRAIKIRCMKAADPKNQYYTVLE